MAEQEGQGDNYAGTDQNAFQGFPHLPVARAFPKLFKQGDLIPGRISLTPLPFAHRDRMDAGKLGKLDLVEAELPAQMSNIRCVQQVVF